MLEIYLLGFVLSILISISILLYCIKVEKQLSLADLLLLIITLLLSWASIIILFSFINDCIIRNHDIIIYKKK